MHPLKFALRSLLFIFLTVLTQIGGLVYLLSLLTHKPIDSRIKKKFLQFSLKIISFLIFYLVSTLVIVPLLANLFGRTALPLTETNSLQPLNILTCLFNRHYVQPELKQATIDAAERINKKYPGTTINYLEANFPFFDGFPLIPHLSHNDGKKLDLAFLYIDNKTGKQTNEAPSFIGYGINEEPRPGERSTTDYCTQKGYWQYSFLGKFVAQGNNANFTFDGARTKELVNLFASNPAIGKIFIEPHLKERLKLSSEKIRFHGCQAVRHDDHVHVQLKVND